MSCAAPVRPSCEVQSGEEEVREESARGEALGAVPNTELSYEPQGEEEAQRAVGVTCPGKPTPKEIAEHELTHLPHRSWCAACVGGRSRDRLHKRLGHCEQPSVPCVVFDYGFLGSRDEEETVAVQIARDVDTKMLFAHVVPRKGLIANHGVNQMLRDLDTLGHKKMRLKSDGEPALVSIQEEVKRQRAYETLLENSPVGDSRSNGIAERAVQSVAEQIRVLRASLEGKIQAKLPGTHPVTTWLVEHSADLLNKYQVSADGRTAYQRLRGKKWNHEMVEFGEKVHYRINPKGQSRDAKLEPRWGEGYFVGIKWRTGECWVATAGGILKASAIRRVGAHRRWDAEGLLRVKVVPWDHIQKDAEPGAVTVRWLDPAMLPKASEPASDGPQRRRARIHKEDYLKHGFTEGCLGCRALIQGGDTRPHNPACRDRMEEELKKTPEGRARIQKGQERIDDEVARRMEKCLQEEGQPDPKRVKMAPNVGAGGSHPQAILAPMGDSGSASSSQEGSQEMTDQTKRVAEESTADVKKQKLDEGMDIGEMECLMQEDFRWDLGAVSDMCAPVPEDAQRALTDMTYFDENTGEVLDERLVRAAEAEELSRFTKMGVYSYAERSEAVQDPGGIFVNLKWVRVNKGTKEKPQVKCRLVAQELAYGERMDELYANTPSLQSVRMALAFATRRARCASSCPWTSKAPSSTVLPGERSI